MNAPQELNVDNDPITEAMMKVLLAQREDGTSREAQRGSVKVFRAVEA